MGEKKNAHFPSFLVFFDVQPEAIRQGQIGPAAGRFALNRTASWLLMTIYDLKITAPLSLSLFLILVAV